MGLLGGVHCFGMCGGIVAMLTAAIPERQRSSLKKSSRFHLSYNLGRILSYIVMGALFGSMGEARVKDALAIADIKPTPSPSGATSQPTISSPNSAASNSLARAAVNSPAC